MSTITIEKAAQHDARALTAIIKAVFDEEASKWLADEPHVVDPNIQPPRYDAYEMTWYMINELNYFKIMHGKDIIGGVIVTISGGAYGRIDRIFIDPSYQNQGIGGKAIRFIEEVFADVHVWDLETSSRQISNHHFYEKMGFELTFKTADEHGYTKHMNAARKENVIQSETRPDTKYEHCNMAGTSFYEVNLENSAYSTSNLMNSHVSNCNMSQSKFQNINFTNAYFADLNFSRSEFVLPTLSGVRFIDADLGAENEPLLFERCDLTGSEIKNCTLKNVEINNCDLTGMKINNISVGELLEVYRGVKGK
ncbi:GNAT family N-acetyltransferase [Shouchella lonarensis]|nr:GNAT family N-acetyltransferase [Shouchella lonarensis]